MLFQATICIFSVREIEKRTVRYLMLFWYEGFVHLKLKLLDCQLEFVLRLFGIIIVTSQEEVQSSFPAIQALLIHRGKERLLGNHY